MVDSFRARLEGRLELLETARTRYRALLPMVRSLRWRTRLRKNAALLRETARSQPEVERALRAALRRASAEGWPQRSEAVRVLEDVKKQSGALREAVCRRLHVDDEGQGLSWLLERLEAEAVTGPRTILPGQRWATALELLPANLAEVRAAAEFGDFLEHLFKRPFEPDGRLPLTKAEAEALCSRWASGEAALAALFRRVERVDRTGSLWRRLRKKARRAPLRPPRNGPEHLLHAAFWHELARARLNDIVRHRLSPLEPSDEELWPVLVWLCAREEDDGIPLTGVTPDGRAALFELAYALWYGLESRRKSAGNWAALSELASRADALDGDADLARMRDTLRLFLRIRGGDDSGQSLTELVEAARSVFAERAPRAAR